MDKIFDCSLDDLLRLLSTSIIIYILVIFYVRILGKRSTSELNNFDWIVTVSIGSIFASTVILEDISVYEGAFSMLFLFLLQFLVTKGMYKFVQFRKVVKSTPQLLFFEGDFIEENMKRERITDSEIYAAIRQKGLKSIKQIYAVVLETNSKLSVIPNDDNESLGFSLSDVQGLPDGLKQDLKDRNEADG